MTAGVRLLQNYGLNVFIHPHIRKKQFDLAGTPQERVNLLHELF